MMSHREIFYYDTRSNVTCVRDDDLGLTYYTYDAGNRMTSVKNPFGEVAYYEYTAGGRMTRRILGNGCVTYYSYDPIGRVSKVDNRKSDLSVISSFEYERDPVGNPVSIVREDGSVVYYEYDPKHQLTRETQRDSQGQDIYAWEWDHDAAGNRTYQIFNGVTTYYQYNEANELTEETTDGVTTYYSYDRCGNTTAKQEATGTTYYHWDYENLLTQIDLPDGAHNYFTYDGDSKRVSKQDSEGFTEFIYQGPDMLKLLLERDDEGTTQAHYTMGNGLEAMWRDSTSSFYHYDGLGSTFELTDAVEDVTDTWRYNAWGQVLERMGSTVNPHTYVGRQRYYETPDPTFYLLGMRYYSDRFARFLCLDPHRQADNWYVYGGNRPLTRLDPTGLMDVMLTFDDGPSKFSELILHSLIRHRNPRVGFFWVGKRMMTRPRLVTTAETYGHLVHHHSYSHPEGLFREFYSRMSPVQIWGEICKWEEAYGWASGRGRYGPPKHWRAPAWDFKPWISGIFSKHSYSRHSGAHVASRDAALDLGVAWQPNAAKRLAFCVIKYLKKHSSALPSPCIIGWHDHPDVGPFTPEAIEIFLTEALKHNIKVEPYQPFGGPTGEPKAIEWDWVMSNCIWPHEPWETV